MTKTVKKVKVMNVVSTEIIINLNQSKSLFTPVRAFPATKASSLKEQKYEESPSRNLGLEKKDDRQ